MSLDRLPHLFVEGKTDKYVIVQLLKSHKLFAQDGDKKPETPDKVQIVVSLIAKTQGSSGSKTEVLNDISLRLRFRSQENMAIGL
ncbi:MAG: hypothetical protein FD138_1993 [Planctomycetota bacterium]|nr:MAG: hypothetical protein FD138_1993 [Planctomycetota bacterium]